MHMRCTSDTTGLDGSGLKRLYADERGNAKRIVLLVILLLVLIAAAVFLLFPDLIAPPAPAPAPPAQNQVKRKVVQLPKKPAAKPEVKPVAEKPAATAENSAAKVEAKQPAPAPETKPKAASTPASKPAPKPAASKPPATVGPKGPYTVTAGAYLMSSSVEQADKSVRALGFTPHHTKVKRDIEVTRLKEGTYGEAEARARAAQYKREFSAESFVLKDSQGWTVYLGSYVGLDRARIHADRLYAQGVRLTEVKALVPMSLTLVRFGDFPDQAAAQKAVAKAKASGLDAYVSKVK